MMKEFWNERYAQDEYVYGIQPNRFFEKELKKLEPGSLILTCEGEGRNAVFAERLGWDVKAFDYSNSAIDKAKKLAAKHDVELDYQFADFTSVEFPEKSADAVAMIFNHFPPELRKKAHQKVQKWLKPRGVLILQGFHTDQLKYGTGGPKDEDMLFTEALLSEDFKDMNISHLHSHEAELDEGIYHQGKAAVIELVATKRVKF